MKARILRPALPLLLAGAAASAGAADAGDNVLQFGWLHLMPRSTSTALHTELQPSLIGTLTGVQSSFDSPGTSAGVADADTAGFIGTRFLTEHFALQLVAGVPAQVGIEGQGTVAPTGLLGQFLKVDLGTPANQPLVSVREWTPLVLLQYYFDLPEGLPGGGRKGALHPYIGAGISYAWFSDFKVNGEFRQQLQSNFGQLLAFATGHPGTTQVSASASRSWSGAFNAGLACDLSQHWSLAASVTYSPLASTAHIDIKAADGSLLASSSSRLSQEALVTALLLNYRFRFP
ncbi:MAG TPA: OmpW family outer membrane protein [Nevskia sp.]|nr:OmpW family outer membrane protein [Nevskia sp.]